jgi:broad specificity phosphatase PhoE
MRIYLIRHGETDSNAARIVQLPTDPLSARGIQQSLRLASRLAGCDIKRLVSSDLERAVMTAAQVAATTGLEAEFTSVLQERSFGSLRGTPYDELTFDPFAHDYQPPGGESWDQFHDRVGDAWAHIEGVAAENEPVAVITHGLVLRSILARRFGVDLNSPEAAATARMIPNTSVTIVDKTTAGWRVGTVACIEHLNGLVDSAGTL